VVRAIGHWLTSLICLYQQKQIKKVSYRKQIARQGMCHKQFCPGLGRGRLEPISIFHRRLSNGIVHCAGSATCQVTDPEPEARTLTLTLAITLTLTLNLTLTLTLF